MNEEKMIEILEGLDVPEDTISQIINQFAAQPVQKESYGAITDNFLEDQIERETDPFKKASLIAKKISKSFEEE